MVQMLICALIKALCIKPAIVNNLKIVKILLEHGEGVNSSSPFCKMCEFGNDEIVPLFIYNGTDVNYDGLSPLY